MKSTIYRRSHFYPSFSQVMNRLIWYGWLSIAQRRVGHVSPGYNPRPVPVRAQPDVEWFLVGFHLMLESHLCNMLILTL